jgi:predicted transcriptional regulator
MLYYPHMTSSQDENVNKKLSDALKKKREELGLTQDQIAELTGFKSNYYAKIERGEINLTMKNMNKIISSLKIDANKIFPA